LNTMFSRLAEGRENNFLLLRLIAAAAVIVSHSYPIALGSSAMEPLQQFGPTLGTVAVWAFFGVSGFLIFKSFEGRSLGVFASARVKRVFPALIFVSLLSVFVMGPLFTSLPLRVYFAARGTWEYIPRAISLKWVTQALPGIFAGNPYPAVNGPLWTLYYEVFCYVVLALAGLAGLLKRFPLFLLLCAIAYVIARDTIYAPLCLAFVTGMVAYRYRGSIPAWAVVIPWAAVLLTSAAMPAAVAATALWLSGLRPMPFTRRDYSYGLYIYGWPVQEILIHQMPWLSPTQLTLIALPIALLCAAASWHLVEEKVMKSGFRIPVLRPRKAAPLINS
jgi:peptidoglycan/LPS O-acetylase OafA/YrhL